MQCKYWAENAMGFLVRGVMLALAGVFACAAGCSRDGGAAAGAPPAKMGEKEFAAKSAEVMAARQAIVMTREGLVARMEEMVAAARAKVAGGDEAAIRAELEKDPAWRSLVRRMEDANVAYEDNLKAAHRLIAARNPKNRKISK